MATSDEGDVWISAGGTPAVRDLFPRGHTLQPLLFPVTENGATTWQVAVVDRTTGAMRLVDLAGADVGESQNVPLGEPVNAPALDDVDGDGLPEIVFTTASGKVGYWKPNGALPPGWPPTVESESFASAAGPVTLGPAPSSATTIVASLGNGVLAGITPGLTEATGFPLPLSIGARGTPAVGTGASPNTPPVLYAADGDSLLHAFAVIPESGPAPTGTNWGEEGGDPGRTYSVTTPYRSGLGAASHVFLAGSLKCYPNPARQAPVTFAFRLRQSEQVDIRIFDSAAKQVDHLVREGAASDNAMVWDPTGRPSGLYVARIEAGGEVQFEQVAVIR